MTPNEEIQGLLSKASDGELTADDQLHLAVLLRDDAANQNAYLDYMLLDALLRWEKPQPVHATVVERGHPRKPHRRAGWALAVCLLAGIGVGLFVISPTREVEAKSDVLDKLADWNVAIADAPLPADRRALYRDRVSTLTEEIKRAGMPGDERILADALLEDARTLVESDGPLDMAEGLDATSEKILKWMWSHPDTDPRRFQAMERQYLRIVERSLANLRKAESTSVPNEQASKRSQRVAERIARRTEERIAQRVILRFESKPGR